MTTVGLCKLRLHMLALLVDVNVSLHVHHTSIGAGRGFDPLVEEGVLDTTLPNGFDQVGDKTHLD